MIEINRRRRCRRGHERQVVSRRETRDYYDFEYLFILL